MGRKNSHKVWKNGWTSTRWFKPWPFYPRSLKVTNNFSKRSLNHPKKGTKNCQVCIYPIAVTGEGSLLTSISMAKTSWLKGVPGWSLLWPQMFSTLPSVKLGPSLVTIPSDMKGESTKKSRFWKAFEIFKMIKMYNNYITCGNSI